MVCSNSGRCVVLLFMHECTVCVRVKQPFKQQLHIYMYIQTFHEMR